MSGLGIRVGRQSGPLLDLGLTLESVAVHAFAAVSATETSGGAQLQLSNLAVAVSGASGGNAIASGILADSALAGQKPKPAFSPALAVQRHGSGPVDVTLRAGDGDGPWWVAIQKGFGPLYLEQVGFGVTMPQHRLESVSLLLDARVSLFGLTAAVDDLSITYFVVKGDVFKAESWAVDLGGLAIGAEIGPLSISGGLLKSGSGENVEYLGMLLGRFGVYGLTIYGGYGKSDGVVSFFAVGAVIGPIGGVPAFFVTGIGGGFGINRALVVPTDLSQFADFPLIKALDVAATSSPDPMQELRQLGQSFPPQPGHFWFAAGLSFTSFALVDGIAVVAVQLGDGFELDLLGLARLALPRPQAAIVSIELALVVRVSSKEGVIWVQGQLTDNSWLLYPDVKLTGGFAYVLWFTGPHRGEFVLTMGGFHPDFHRDGYPQVPRLGLQWRYGPIVVKGGCYFALTSEAVMAGVDVSVSADFGCAWARLSFGAHGIVFFDPFHLRVEAYARMSAGITIDTWFGDITFSVSAGAKVTVEGPDFHGRASIDVGPCDVSVSFGSSSDNATPKLTAAQFVPKYLEEMTSGVARAISSIVSDGAVPPRAGTNGATAQPPDGTADRPFVVTAEFSMTVTTQVPASRLDVGGTVSTHAPTHALGIAPMQVASLDPVLTLRWQQGATALAWPFTNVAIQPFGAFPLGVWGPPQSADSPQVPKGEVVQALNQVTITARATESAGGPAISYNRLDPQGPRRPLPFLRNSGATRQDEVDAGQQLVDLVASAAAGGDPAAIADDWRRRAGASAIELASWVGERRLVAPRLGSLGDRLAPLDRTVVPGVGQPVTPEPVDRDGAPAGGARRARQRHAARGHGRWWRHDRLRPPRRRPDRAADGGGAAQRAGRGSPAPRRCRRPGGRRHRRAEWGARGHPRGSLGRGQRGAAGWRGARPSRRHHRRAGRRRRRGRHRRHRRRRGRDDVPGRRGRGAGPAQRGARRGRRRPAAPARGHGHADARGRAAPGRGGRAGRDRRRRRGRDATGGRAAGPGAARGRRRAAVGGGLARRHDAPVRGLGHRARRGGHGAGGRPAGRAPRRPLPGRLGRGRRAGVGRRQRDHPLLASRRPRGRGDRRPGGRCRPAAAARARRGPPGARPRWRAPPPTTVAAGNRAILAYRIDVDPAAAVPVTVTVASGTGWHLVGVLGATGAPADVVAAIAARGFDSVVGAAVPPGRGEATVAWAPAGSPPVDLTPPAPPAPPAPPGGPPSPVTPVGPVTPPVGPVTPPVGPIGPVHPAHPGTPPVGPVTPPVGPIGPVHPAPPGPPPVGPHLPTTGPIMHPVVTEEPAAARSGAPSAPAQPDPKAEKKKAKKKSKQSKKKSKRKRS